MQGPPLKNEQRTHSAAERKLTCAQARELLPRHAKSELNAREQALFRRHILACEECREAYRMAISMTAKVGHALSQNRLERDRRQRRMEARALPFKVGNFGRNRRGYMLRGVIGTALLILLVTRIPGLMQVPTLEATWENGAVEAATRELSQGDDRTELVTGDWVVTSQNGAARVEGGGGLAEVGPGSALLVEDPEGFRVRFQRGSMRVEGRAVVLTQYGIAELRGGRAGFVTSLEGLRIHVLGGELVWTHPAGEQLIKEGDRALVQTPGPLFIED